MIDIDKLSKDRKDWLEVHGNQWAPKRQMAGTCERCVWGRGEHADACDKSLSGAWAAQAGAV